MGLRNWKMRRKGGGEGRARCMDGQGKWEECEERGRGRMWDWILWFALFSCLCVGLSPAWKKYGYCFVQGLGGPMTNDSQDSVTAVYSGSSGN